MSVTKDSSGKDIYMTIQELSDLFLARFANANSLRYKLRQKFETRVQSPTETVTQYTNEMEQLGRELQLSDETMKHAIIRGLLPMIRQVVIQQEPADLAATISKAKIVEMSQTSTLSPPQPSPNEDKRKNEERISRLLDQLELNQVGEQTNTSLFE